jgi:hypothetical protein
MSEGSSGSGPDRQQAEAASADYSSWFREALGEGWVEVEPGIFRHVADEDPAPPPRSVADEEAKSLDETLREALVDLTLDTGDGEAAAPVDGPRSSRPGD